MFEARLQQGALLKKVGRAKRQTRRIWGRLLA